MTNQEHVLWDVDAAGGFGPDDVPLGCRVPPMGAERNQKERTPVSGAGPYHDANKNAPFDQPFYLIFNVAIGGAQNGCPDPNFWGQNAIWCAANSNNNNEGASAATKFWQMRDTWLPTWQQAQGTGRDAFLIDWVKVWQ